MNEYIGEWMSDMNTVYIIEVIWEEALVITFLLCISPGYLFPDPEIQVAAK